MNTTEQPTWGQIVKERMRAKAMRGVPTGPVPLGYRKVYERGAVTVAIDETKAPLVREAFRLAALKRNSLRDILAILTEKGLVSQRGTPLHPSGLWNILVNPFYIGMFMYDGNLINGQHCPLISKEIFNGVQAKLTSRRRHQ